MSEVNPLIGLSDGVYIIKDEEIQSMVDDGYYKINQPNIEVWNGGAIRKRRPVRNTRKALEREVSFTVYEEGSSPDDMWDRPVKKNIGPFPALVGLTQAQLTPDRNTAVQGQVAEAFFKDEYRFVLSEVKTGDMMIIGGVKFQVIETDVDVIDEPGAYPLRISATRRVL